MSAQWRVAILAAVAAMCTNVTGCASRRSNDSSDAVAKVVTALAPIYEKKYRENPVANPTDAEQQLIRAAALGDTGEVKSLLASGVDVNCQGRDGARPLAIAAFSATLTGNLETTKTLLEKGANPNLRAQNGMTALTVSTLSPPVVALLLEHGADPNASTDIGATAISYAAQVEKADVLRLLIAAGAKANVADKDGQTPLDMAIEHERETNAKLLLSAGADVNTRDTMGMGPLLRARTLAMAKLLVNNHADVNVQGGEGYSPLMFAASRGDSELVAYLMSVGADPGLRNRKGQTASELAMGEGHAEVARVIDERQPRK